VLHAHKVVSRQIGVSCIKNIKFGAKNKTFHMIIFIFLHRPQKVSVFDKTLQTHSDCGYVNAKINCQFFLHFEIYFLGRGTVCTWEPN
jgi:hypothetical protein